MSYRIVSCLQQFPCRVLNLANDFLQFWGEFYCIQGGDGDIRVEGRTKSPEMFSSTMYGVIVVLMFTTTLSTCVYRVTVTETLT